MTFITWSPALTINVRRCDEQHEKIVKEMLQDLRKQFQTGGVFSISMLTFLNDWVLDHIWRDGKLYSSYLSGMGVMPLARSRPGCSITV